MTRRIATLVVLAVVGLTATLADPPDAPVTPTFEAPLTLGVPAAASVWHCPWLQAGPTRDAAFLLATEAEVEASLTMPSPILNEEPDTATVSLVGPGSRVVDVGEIVRRGDTPSFVEYTGGPAVVSSVVYGETLLTADRCVTAVPKIWHLPGGTTREGRELRLRLFNPFPDDVKVSITGFSEFGPEPLPDFGSLLVPGRSWVNVELNPEVPLLDDLALVVTATDGVVIPVMVLSGVDEESDQASWPGTGLSTVWYFANATQGGLSATLAVTNPGAIEATITVDLLTRAEEIVGAAQITVPAGAPARIPLGEITTANFGIRVTATQPIGAVVIAEDLPAEPTEGTADEPIDQQVRSRLAGTIGADQAATTWLLAGAGGIPGADSSIWVMNPSGVAATISLEPLGLRDLPVEKLVVQPGRIARFRVPESPAIASYRIEAPVPIVVALGAQTPDAVAFVGSFPIDG